MINKSVIRDIDYARDILLQDDYSIVVVKNNNILIKKKGEGIRPFLEVIKDLKEDIIDSVIADRILGKASALLCRYARVKGVYSPQATKTAIAILVMAGIPSQVDEMVSYIKNKRGDDVCPFEKMLKNIDSPTETYNILMEKIFKKN